MSEERAIDHLPDEPPVPPVAGLCAATTVLGGILGPGGVFLALTMDIGGAVVAFVAAVVVGVVIGRICVRSTRAVAPVLCFGAGAFLGALILAQPWRPARDGTESLGTAMMVGYGICSAIGNFLVSLIAAQLAISLPLKPRSAWAFCEKCRYNLRGNTSGRCPECGTVIPVHLKDGVP